MEYHVHDFSLDGIRIDYNNIYVDIFDPLHEKNEIIKCSNFIGIEYLGQWDENIIKKIELREMSSSIDNIKDIIKNRNNIGLLGGGVRDFNAEWKEMIIYLIDGLEIKVVCQRVDFPVSIIG